MTRFYVFRFVSVCFHLSRPILLSISFIRVQFVSSFLPYPSRSRSFPVPLVSVSLHVHRSRLASHFAFHGSSPFSFQFPRFSSSVQLMTRFYVFRFVSVCFHLSRPITVVYVVYSRSILPPFLPYPSRFRSFPVPLVSVSLHVHRSRFTSHFAFHGSSLLKR